MSYVASHAYETQQSSFSSHPTESITHGTKGQRRAVLLEGSCLMGRVVYEVYRAGCFGGTPCSLLLSLL